MTNSFFQKVLDSLLDNITTHTNNEFWKRFWLQRFLLFASISEKFAFNINKSSLELDKSDLENNALTMFFTTSNSITQVLSNFSFQPFYNFSNSKKPSIIAWKFSLGFVSFTLQSLSPTLGFTLHQSILLLPLKSFWGFL